MFPAGVKATLPKRLALRLVPAVALAVAALLVVASAAVALSGPVSSANARFIAASYGELLGRNADAPGLDFHLGQITAGGSRSRNVMAYGFLFSPEGSTNEVTRAYDELLGRAPDGAGAAYWTAHLVDHGVLDLRVLLMAGQEYRLRAGGTDSAWLDAVYQDVLGRSPETAGRAYWLGLLDVGVAPASVAGAIYNSDEALGRRADSYYHEILSRAPSAAERAAAAQEIRSNGERHLRARLWASNEAFESYLVGAWSP